MMHHAPEQDSLVQNILRLPGKLLNLVGERLKLVAQQQRLLQKAVEIMRPVKPSEAAGKRGGMADHHNHVHIEAARQPLTGEDSNRVFEKRRRMMQTARREVVPVFPHSPHIHRCLDTPEFSAGIEAKSQSTHQWVVKWRFI